MAERDPTAEQDEPAPEQLAAEAPPAAPEPSAPAAEAPPSAPEAAAPAAEAAPAGEARSAPSRVAPSRVEDDDRPRGGRGGGGRRFGRRKVCTFCVEKATSIDYKDPGKLRRYLSDRGRIDARRKTGTCAKHQRWLALALKRARHLALMPYSPEHIRVTGMFASRR